MFYWSWQTDEITDRDMTTGLLEKTSVTTPDSIRIALNELNAIAGNSWREIALLSQYSGIPAGTLSAIAKGYPIPKKWHARFGIVDPVPVMPCPIHGIVHDYDCQAQEVFPIGQASIKRKPAAQVNEPPRLTAKVTDGLHRAVMEHARYEGVAISEIVRRALEAYLLPEIFMGRSLETEAAALPANGTHGKGE